MKILEATRSTYDKSMSHLTAAILAGGLGTRFRPVVADRPKVLAEVHGRPFLTILLDYLSNAGLREVVLFTGYMANQVRETFGERYCDLYLLYSEEAAPMGTGDALRLALPLTGSNTALILNGDSSCRTDLSSFYSFHRAMEAEATVLLSEVPDATRYGIVELDVHGRITSFCEKGAATGRGLVNAGIYLVGRMLLATIPAGRAVSLERELFPD